MINAAIDTEAEEKPLDPAVEKVRRKMMRLMLISIGIMMVGLMAVLFAIVYKTGSDSAARQAPVASGDIPSPAGNILREGAIPLPIGARVLSHAVSGATISLQAELADGSTAIFVYDAATDRMIGRFAIVAE